MSTHRSSRQHSDEGRSRRRYSKKSNPTGIIVVVGVIAVLIVIVMTMYKRFGEEYADTADDPAPSVEDGNSGKPAAGNPSSESNDGPRNPDRPAPELTADVIKTADAIFHEAKVLYATADQADEDGDSEGYKRLIRDCRVKFKRLDSLLAQYKRWLVEARSNNWEIATIYKILERRAKKYKKFEDRVPPGDSNPR